MTTRPRLTSLPPFRWRGYHVVTRSAFSFTAGLVVGGSVVGYAAWLVVDGTLKQAELLAVTLNILVGVPPPAYLEKRQAVAASSGGTEPL